LDAIRWASRKIANGWKRKAAQHCGTLPGSTPRARSDGLGDCRLNNQIAHDIGSR
jgi:hypothetical protein